MIRHISAWSANCRARSRTRRRHRTRQDHVPFLFTRDASAFRVRTRLLEHSIFNLKLQDNEGASELEKVSGYWISATLGIDLHLGNRIRPDPQVCTETQRSRARLHSVRGEFGFGLPQVWTPRSKIARGSSRPAGALFSVSFSGFTGVHG